jgi:hypothetical protein
MILRRAAIVLAGITAAAFMAAGSASAATMGDGGQTGGKMAGKSSSAGAFSYENMGGPWGITHAKGAFQHSMGYFGDSDSSY